MCSCALVLAEAIACSGRHTEQLDRKLQKVDEVFPEPMLRLIIDMSTGDRTEEERAARVKLIRATWNDPVKRAAAVEALPALFNEMADVLDMKPDDAGYDRAVSRLEAHRLASPFGDFSGGRVSYFVEKRKTRAVRLALLEAAMALKLDGEDAFKQVFDPEGGEPFERVPTATGYELFSKLTRGKQRESLRVGPEKP